jgi:hypothetical protein
LNAGFENLEQTRHRQSLASLELPQYVIGGNDDVGAMGQQMNPATGFLPLWTFTKWLGPPPTFTGEYHDWGAHLQTDDDGLRCLMFLQDERPHARQMFHSKILSGKKSVFK